VSEEPSEDVGTTIHPVGFPFHLLLDGGKGIRGEVGQAPVFQVGPGMVHGVELGSVRGKPGHMPVRPPGEPGPDLLVRVDPGAVPQEDHRAPVVAAELLEHAQDLGPAHVGLRVQGEVEGHPPATGRQDQGADGRDLLVGPGAEGEQRGLPARGPGTPEHGGHEEPGFVQADQPGTAAGQFFLTRGHSCWSQRRMRRSLRSLAVRWGRWGVSPQARSRRPIWAG